VLSPRLYSDQPIVHTNTAVSFHGNTAFDELEPIASLEVSIPDESLQFNAGVCGDDQPGPFGGIGAIDGHLDLRPNRVEVFDQQREFAAEWNGYGVAVLAKDLPIHLHDRDYTI
jgi:hypothetical protein